MTLDICLVLTCITMILRTTRVNYELDFMNSAKPTWYGFSGQSMKIHWNPILTFPFVSHLSKCCWLNNQSFWCFHLLCQMVILAQSAQCHSISGNFSSISHGTKYANRLVLSSQPPSLEVSPHDPCLHCQQLLGTLSHPWLLLVHHPSGPYFLPRLFCTHFTPFMFQECLEN